MSSIKNQQYALRAQESVTVSRTAEVAHDEYGVCLSAYDAFLLFSNAT